MSNQFDDIGLTHTGGPNHQDIVLNHADPGLFPFTGRIFRIPVAVEFYPVEMGADLGCQNRFDQILFDNKTVQIGFQFLGHHIEMEPCPIRFSPSLAIGQGLIFLWNDKRRDDLYAITVFLGEVITQFLLKLTLIRYPSTVVFFG